MIDSLISTIYIDFLLQDSNISFIEVWEDRLFVWKYKGSPRITTNLGLDFTYPIYYRANDYRKLSKKYHPDLTTSKSSKVLSGLVQSIINDFREAMDERNGGYAADDYTEFYSELHTAYTSKNASARAELAGLQTRLLNRARLVQDKFGGRSESFTNTIFQAVATRPEGEGLKDFMQEFFEETRSCLSEDRIRYWNQTDTSSANEENQFTYYGRTRRANQIGLRRSYGDVFRVYAGGAYDTSSLKARRHNCRPTKRQ